MELKEKIALLVKGELPSDINVQSIIDEAVEKGKSGALEGIKALQEKNNEILDELKQAKKQRVPENFNLDEYKKLIEEREENRMNSLKGEEKWEAMRAKQDEVYKTELLEKNRTIENYINTIKNDKASALITNAIAKENGNATLLTPHISSSVGVKEENGQFISYVKDINGNPRIDSETGKQFTIEQLVKEFKSKEVYAPAFLTSNSGGGANGGAGNQNVINNPFVKFNSNGEKNKHYNVTEQVKLAKQNPELAKQLKASAQ